MFNARCLFSVPEGVSVKQKPVGSPVTVSQEPKTKRSL